MDNDFAKKYALDWITAWNGRDFDAILAYYDENIAVTSPFIAKLAGEPSGTLKGKSAVRTYLEHILEANPNLRFELLLPFHGVDSVVIHYRSHRAEGSVLVAEVFFFNSDNKVIRSYANYGVA